MKLLHFFLIFCLICFVNSIIIHCDYKESLTYGYKCEVGYLQIISKVDRNITGVTGQHKIGKNNDDVKFFHTSGKIVSFLIF